MKNYEDGIENLLNAWRPRRLPAELGRRIFAAARTVEPGDARGIQVSWRLALGTVVAVMGLLVLLEVERSGHLLGAGASARGGWNSPFFLVGSLEFNCGRNAWARASFASTNRGGSPSSIHSSMSVMTNSLRPD